MGRDLLGFSAGFLVSLVTSPVGVSGAVFLLPIQLSLFGVPNPQVTPTNLLYNVLAGPGAILRYARQGQFRGPLFRQLAYGSVPGVILGAVLRVYVADDPGIFRLVAAAVLLPTGAYILRSSRPQATPRARGPLGPRTIGLAAFAVGTVGGIYGIGGGSILGPLLVGSGMAVSRVAPAALASTFVTSVVGVVTFAVLQTRHPARSRLTGRSAWRADWADWAAAMWAPRCSLGCRKRSCAGFSALSPSASLSRTPSRRRQVLGRCLGIT